MELDVIKHADGIEIRPISAGSREWLEEHMCEFDREGRFIVGKADINRASVILAVGGAKLNAVN